MSSEQSRNKTLGLLSICIKAGKTVPGADPAAEAARSGKAKCLMTVTDASERTVRTAQLVSERTGVPHYRAPITKEDTERLFGKQSAVIAVCDAGFAAAFAKHITGKSE